MTHAFPEDELRPISCNPLVRDRDNEDHFELNDVLGNYSLTLIDSLSTLALFASAPSDTLADRNPLEDFQNGVAYLVALYGDGKKGQSGQGIRGRGFDVDSKVQVFETVIRGVGGLLSAHLFAIGELPIKGSLASSTLATPQQQAFAWPNGLLYDGQLLRLAHDLARRLLPAFQTPTGLPYPRVNLKHGIPFYPNAPINQDAEYGQCLHDNQSEPAEVTETCSAGAGSLVLEFAVLSRLTGDSQFEDLAKSAFRAVWGRRSHVGLIGAGIDAETGRWVSPYTGIGAGVDSFFEYAMKSHVLLASSDKVSQDDSDYFLEVWLEAHASIKHHLYRDRTEHPHYIQGDLFTGATRALWMDSLSAYYPGLLTLSGNLDEAIRAHLLLAALWTRYSAIPERWNTATGAVESGLHWWGGRPEFVESTWYLYRATADPWYLRIGEMVLNDIYDRCWTPCGWAGIENVKTGELKDRMESFFLGETAKYLYLLFDSQHPLNHVDGSFVFSTEGHPLKLPRTRQPTRTKASAAGSITANDPFPFCQKAPDPLALSVSSITSRGDFFHAAALARLHLAPVSGAPLNGSLESSAWDENILSRILDQQANQSFYPWTIPSDLIPHNGQSSKIESSATFDLSFPPKPNALSGPLMLQRNDQGVIINSVNGLTISMTKESQSGHIAGRHALDKGVFRIQSVSHLALGRDEKVFISPAAVAGLNPVDPLFTKQRDMMSLDVVFDTYTAGNDHEQERAESLDVLNTSKDELGSVDNSERKPILNELFTRITGALGQNVSFAELIASGGVSTNKGSLSNRSVLTANTATGKGAAPLPDVPDVSVDSNQPLEWTSFYMTDEACEDRLPTSAPRDHQVIIMRRGKCTFSEKLNRIPSYAPFSKSLQVVLVVSFPEDDGDMPMSRPLLDEDQHTPSGVIRRHPIPMLLVEGDPDSFELLKAAQGLGLRRRYFFSSQGLQIGNLFLT